MSFRIPVKWSLCHAFRKTVKVKHSNTRTPNNRTMRCTILASGSKGNCIFLEGECGALLLDAGLSTKETLHANGERVS